MACVMVRDRWPNERVFTYWDYRAGMFHQDLGMRIDLVLASATVADRVKAAWVDRHARKGSVDDYAPVIVDLDEAPDGDIGPAVPPPSAPVTRRGLAKLPQTLQVRRTRNPATIADVAAHAGVGASTVSRVLNGGQVSGSGPRASARGHERAESTARAPAPARSSPAPPGRSRW